MSLKAEIKPKNVIRQACLVIIMLLTIHMSGISQKDSIGFWDYPTSLNRGRFWSASTAGIVAYTGTLITLNELWYKQYPRTSFHFFNDAAEWQQMDKAGHMFTAYFEADWLHSISRWTGMGRKSSILSSAIVATGLQATVETLDGFSSKWGFSVYDFISNVGGSSLWAVQQMAWDEQRIRMKVSSTYRTYPEEIVQGSPSGTTTIKERTNDLFGENILQSFLKDYNAQTVWISVNVHSFLPEENKFPKWLNVAFGYGAENMFGGFRNEWELDGNKFELNNDKYPRYRQFYLSPDIDLSKIKIKSKPLKMLVCMVNIFKIPAPALEINGNGGMKWKWIYY
ncbi:MAG TPA: DUF2279 domain-containing protein [Saprospiraceae bacterium]|nr:DUF2279 domain-containing protein [Saprospiraceae bacterium]